MAPVKLEYVTKYAAYGPPPGALALKCSFRTVTVRNVDKRPYPEFDKAYGGKRLLQEPERIRPLLQQAGKPYEALIGAGSPSASHAD